VPAVRREWDFDAAAVILFAGAEQGRKSPQSAAGQPLENPKGDRSGMYSIRVNQQWRICFKWTAARPEDIEIVDYH